MVLYTEAAAVDANLFGAHGTLVKRDLTHHDLSARWASLLGRDSDGWKMFDGFPKRCGEGKGSFKKSLMKKL